MGEQQLDVVTSDELTYVPVSEFARLRAARLDAVPQAEAWAALCRVNTLYMIARAWSGHIGTSFSSLEILSWLFLEEIRDLDKGPLDCDIFFSSKGHDAPALYAVLVGLGLLPADKLHQLRRLHGLPGHPHVETPYVQANTGSLGMGISKAKGMVLANRLNGHPRRVFVLTGDGELQEGQIWESLGSAAAWRLGELTVIVDATRVQSDTWVERVSPPGDLEAKFRAFGWHVSRCDGHDVGALAAAFRRLDAVADTPRLLIADTVKGKGVSFMEGRLPGAAAGAGDAPGDGRFGPFGDGLYKYHS
ncbi:MAG TPA: transketolase, partial [Candidatus Limnocylindrales bacterium]|nr:transketolase [Candidatus Limnocylindrales bacterium]